MLLPGNDFVCPFCQGTLQSNTVICQCDDCAAQYPMVNQRIPVLQIGAGAYLGRQASQLQLLIERMKKESSKLRSAADQQEWRAESLHTFADAISKNQALLNEIYAQLLPFLAQAPLTSAKPDYYTANLSYLRRDWGGSSDEKEIQIVLDSLQKLLSASDINYRSAFVPGAATARYAWELCAKFQQVYAVEQAFPMAALFYKLIESEIHFFDLQPKDARSPKDQLMAHKAAIRAATGDIAQRLGRLKFWVGDALQNPLRDGSIDVVFSIFFTDVLPLRLYLEEVKRVLRKGGTFVHYGPLHYHFNSIADMLSLEEVKSYLKMEGFEIMEEFFEEGKHLSPAQSLEQSRYMNWALAARYTS